MSLRFKIATKTVNPDKSLTLGVEYTYTSATGEIVHSATAERTWPAGTTRTTVIQDIRTAAVAEVTQLAVIAIDADLGKIYERQTDNTWKEVTA
jgi:hypothetical protein